MVCSNVLFLYVIPCHEFYQNLHSLYHFDATRTRLTDRKGEKSTEKSQMSYSENKFQFLWKLLTYFRGQTF